MANANPAMTSTDAMPTALRMDLLDAHIFFEAPHFSE